jgi:dienelactone hydrolase
MAFREYLTTEVGENWVDGLKTYPGVDHAFFNDTGGRYNPTQAAAAWADVLAWLERHLRG